MKLILATFLLTFPVFAVEVATIDEVKEREEILLSFTEDSLYSTLDKLWVPHSCKTRFVINGTVKETFTSKSCRAQVIQFLLKAGYKLHPDGSIFTK